MRRLGLPVALQNRQIPFVFLTVLIVIRMPPKKKLRRKKIQRIKKKALPEAVAVRSVALVAEAVVMP
jgi:hypothetical protein